MPHLRLAALDPANGRAHLRAALDILQPLAAANRLDARRTGWIAAIEGEPGALAGQRCAKVRP